MGFSDKLLVTAVKQPFLQIGATRIVVRRSNPVYAKLVWGSLILKTTSIYGIKREK
jgi:hypothetical protein